MAVDCSFMPSALEALMDIASMRPDLLITDLNMPGVDGMEMLRALTRNQQLLSMQILVISGLPKEAITERGGLPPNSHYLEKPINFDWLHGYVTALLVANRKWR
jgi:DNA-binding response OmpR family regulator